MMSKKQWLALLLVFVTYLLLGATVFYHIERTLEMERRQEQKRERIEIQDMLHKHYAVNSPTSQRLILDKLSEYCGRPLGYNGSREGEDDEPPFHWDFYNSFFFVITVVSTIGYGNLAPTSALGRILMIFYGLIGIPMNGILLATLGEFFSNAFLRVHRRYKSQRLETRAGLITDIVLYLVPGFVVFIFLPAGMFVYFEGWTFDEAVYYAFVTLTTIGFGDYVAGQTNKGHGNWFVLYKVLLIVWIVFGLGYLVMILGFITRAMRSKRMVRLEHKLAVNLKTTQSKLWQSFTKDVSYLRRVLNELYLLKIKPVYRDHQPTEFRPRPRSVSLPAIRCLRDDGSCGRRRANSETLNHSLPRVFSESHLGRIDKDATFRSAAIIQPSELLARFVGALNDMPDCPPEKGGVHGFSDSQILASEHCGSGWTLGGEPVPPLGIKNSRTRAASEYRIPMQDAYTTYVNMDDRSLPSNAEWTWSGVEASRRIHKLIRARQKSPEVFTERKVQETPKPKKRQLQRLASHWKNTLNKRNKKNNANSVGTLFFSSGKRASLQEGHPFPSLSALEQEDQHYLTHTAGGLLQHNYLNDSGSLFSDEESNATVHSMLEQTSVADFFRAMTSVHSRIGVNVQDKSPKRRTGNVDPPMVPSLMSLFNPPASLAASPTVSGKRRFSLRPVPGSALPSPIIAGKRRFSLRPVPGSSLPTVNTNNDTRRYSLRPPGTPPSPYIAALSSGRRRYSLRPTPSPSPLAFPPSPLAVPALSNHRSLSSHQAPQTISSNLQPSQNLKSSLKTPPIFQPIPTGIPSRALQGSRLSQGLGHHRQLSDPNITPRRRRTESLLEDVVYSNG